MENCHRSKGLDNFLGREVKIIFFDGAHYKGVLSIDNHSFRYCLTNKVTGDKLCFCKSHIKEVIVIEEVR